MTPKRKASTISAYRELLSRQRITKILTEASKKILTVLVAGTGYGKTTAVRTFLAETGKPHLWFHLMELDNFLPRFWGIFTQALRDRYPEYDEEIKRLSFPDTPERYEQFQRLLEATVAGEDEPLILVFDDYHTIENPLINSFVKNLMDLRSRYFSIFILSRQDLPFSANHLYNYDELSWLTSKFLHFTREEIQAFFELLGLAPVSRRLLDETERSTEGWPLAIYLMANNLVVQHHQGDTFDPVIPTLPFLYQLFADEFYDTLSPQIQQLFVRLSLLGDFSMDVLEELAGDGFAEVMPIVNNHLFITYDPNMKVYYFHNLLQEFLRQKQRGLTDEERREVFSQAATWAENNAYYLDAITYYLKIDDFNSAWRVIFNYEISIPYNDAEQLLNFIEAFPPAFKAQEPYVDLIVARLHQNNGKMLTAKTIFESIVADFEKREPTPENLAIIGEASIFLSFIAMLEIRDDFLPLMARADACLPQGSALVDQKMMINNGNYAVNVEDPSPGSFAHFEALMTTYAPHAEAAMNGCSAGCDALTKAEAAYYQGELNQAVQYAHDAIYRAQFHRQWDIIAMGYFYLIRAAIAVGNAKDLKVYLSRLHATISSTKFSQADAFVDIIDGWVYAQFGQTERVPDWIKSEDASRQVMPNVTIGRDRLVRAKTYFADGQYFELMAFLDYLEEFYARRKTLLPRVGLHAMKAVAAHRMDNEALALTEFTTASKLALGNNIIMPFVELGNPMRSLMLAAAKQDLADVPQEWIHSIATKAATYAKRVTYVKAKLFQQSPEERLPVPLTKREKAMLLSLSQGLTREEIAGAHNISINTVKSELKTIYSKIGAVNSADAVRIAAVLGLL